MRRLSKILFFIGIGLLFAGPAESAENVGSKTPDATGKFCHFKFPAIREDTLYSDRPMFKDAGSGDIVDIYAPSDYDPLGKAEVARQQAQRRHLRDYHLYSDRVSVGASRANIQRLDADNSRAAPRTKI